jgi:hypothetical protein
LGAAVFFNVPLADAITVNGYGKMQIQPAH